MAVFQDIFDQIGSTTVVSNASQPWKMPPVAKIYEALGALGDRRVQVEDDRHATVISSDGRRKYRVEISADWRTISSNDNASYWQGYLGYPAIAVLLLHGLCDVRKETINALTGISWNELNRRFHNDYTRTIDEVKRRAEDRGFDSRLIAQEAEMVLTKLAEFAPLRGSRRRPAPTGS
jgi:hypothetical protein